MFKIHEFKKRDPRLCSYLKVAVYHYVIMCTLNDIYYVNELCASIKTINQKKKIGMHASGQLFVNLLVQWNVQGSSMSFLR